MAQYVPVTSNNHTRNNYTYRESGGGTKPPEIKHSFNVSAIPGSNSKSQKLAYSPKNQQWQNQLSFSPTKGQNLTNKSYIDKQHLLPKIDDIYDIGYGEFKIPPDPKVTEDYKTASKFGYIVDYYGDICNVSHLPVFNRDYSFMDKESKYDQNGLGFNLFFKYTFFAFCILLGALCIPAAILLISIYANGKQCGARYVPQIDKRSTDASFALREYTHLDAEEVVVDVFESTVNFLSSGFLKAYGRSLCTDVDKKLKDDYQKFCEDYRSVNCQNEAGRKDCLNKMSTFYRKKEFPKKCEGVWYNYLSVGNTIKMFEEHGKEKSVNAKTSLQHILFLLLFIAMVCYQYWQKDYINLKKAKGIENNQIYLKLTGLPHGPRYKNYPLAKQIVQLFRSFGYIIVNISFAHYLDDYLKIEKELKAEKNKEVKEQYSRSNGGFFDILNPSNYLLNKSKMSIAEKERKIAYFEQMFKNDDPELMIGRAYIGFDTVSDRDSCYNRYRYEVNGIKKQLFIQAGTEVFPLKLAPAELPDDLIWEDLEHGTLDKFFRKWISITLSLVVILGGFYFLYRLKVYQVSSNRILTPSRLQRILLTK